MKKYYVCITMMDGSCTGWIRYQGAWKGFIETVDKVTVKLIEWKNAVRAKKGMREAA